MMTLNEYKNKKDEILAYNTFFFLDADMSNSLNDHDVFRYIRETDDPAVKQLYGYKDLYSDFFDVTCILLQLDGKYLITPSDRMIIKNAVECVSNCGLEMLYRADKLNSAINEDLNLNEVQKGYIKRYLKGVRKEIFEIYEKAKATGI